PEIPLYPNEIPNNIPGENKEKSVSDGILRISNVRIPTLRVFLPPKEKANGTAVVICPGGGYRIVAIGHEGYDVAKKFNEAGVAAVVLKYRLPDSAISPQPEIAPLQDAQQAILTVRQNSQKWNIDPNRVGIMGFSAGGHLASTAGTHFKKILVDYSGNLSARPDFMILGYPVISADTSISHRGSFNSLLGKNPSAEKLKEYSNELQVTAETPPAFLVHSSDDGGVKPDNSIRFYLALLKNKVAAELHLYEKGGHGYGMNNPTTNDKWMERCFNWMQNHGWLKK
ncbi:MAG: alpha/beta hydrolase, partial [Chitinophagaceae bacterium]|nr:alpha/beta hydrolase [Chitinophagaceae bacterium]